MPSLTRSATSTTCSSPPPPPLPPQYPAPIVTLGHLATVTQLSSCLTPYNSFLLSSDSDGKVRISHHPRHYDIAAFCLSDAFVSAFAVLEEGGGGGGGMVVTGGLGGKLVAWEVATGRRLAEVRAFDEEPEGTFVTALVWEPVSRCVVASAYPLSRVAVVSVSGTQLSAPTTVALSPASAAPVASLACDGKGVVYAVTEECSLHSLTPRDGQWTQGSVDLSSLQKALAAVRIGDGEDAGTPVWSTSLTVYHRLLEKRRRAAEAESRAQHKLLHPNKRQRKKE